ncbi:MAG TPA: adenylate kinase [Desulfurococcaceae archaeon]|nr:adenylate kinase [Desulfurococcaceae archaeon]
MGKDIPRHPFIVIVVLGVPGVGKTTVLNNLVKFAKEKQIRIVIKNLGDYMLREALKHGFVSNRDELRYLKIRQQLELQLLAAKSIIQDAYKELSENDVLIIDTHAVIRTKYGYWTGIPRQLIDELKPDAFIVIEADVNEIISRQLRDKSRYRADFAKPEIVSELMELTRRNAFSAALFNSSLVRIVLNREGEAENAAKEILEVIEGLR